MIEFSGALDIFFLRQKNDGTKKIIYYESHVRFVIIVHTLFRARASPLLLRRRGLRKARETDEETKAFVLSPPNLDWKLTALKRRIIIIIFIIDPKHIFFISVSHQSV